MQKEFQTFLKTVNFLINSSPISHFAKLNVIKLTTVFGAGNETRTRDPRFRNAWVCGYELYRVVSFC